MFNQRGSGFVSIVACLGASFVAIAGCSSNHTEDIGHQGSALTAPSAVGQFVFLASGRVSISDRTTVSGGNVGSAATTGDAVNAGSDARLAVGNGIIGQRIVLGDRARAGDLFATQVVAPFATFNSLSPFSAPPSLPPIVAFVAGTTAVNVNSGQTVTLAAGSFGAVNINGGTLRLSGGTYQLQSVKLGPDASLVAAAPSVVHVAAGINGADRVHIIPAAPQTASALRLVIA
ncbi:MAG TPA: hypothetical protein VGL13_07365, partial [Polyangiaceae bacterium]